MSIIEGVGWAVVGIAGYVAVGLAIALALVWVAEGVWRWRA